MNHRSMPAWCRLPLACVATALLTACAAPPTAQGPLRPETLIAVTDQMELITFNAGQPGKVLTRKPVTGLPTGDRLLGIDFRVARGVLYALSMDGRLYTLDTATGGLTSVGSAVLPLAATGGTIGFDFNPTVDRIRVVTPAGDNLRLHPDTGAMVDGNPALEGIQPDGKLHYVANDVNANQQPQIVAAGYTYNKKDDKLTTNYAIDRATGALVMQGSMEGSTPVISPNTGQLRTVGSLGLGPLVDAAFDISDLSNAALAAVRTPANTKTQLHLLDLASGRATLLGTVGDGRALIGMAIEP
jgi:hypothetical protein